MAMDLGHKRTDDMLKGMESRIRDIYTQAAKETEQKLKDHMGKYRVKYEKKLAEMKSGKISNAEFLRWNQGQIMIGKRWEEMRSTLATDMYNADLLANSMVNGYLPDVYALNHNYGTFEVEKGAMVDTSYTLYDRQTVERLVKKDPKLLPTPKLEKNRDIRWNKSRFNAGITQGILQGESIPNIAKRVALGMSSSDMQAAIRNARTATTGAENGGRMDSYERAAAMGIPVKKVWMATLDSRTRDSHRLLDGEEVDYNEEFGNGLMFPGDTDGDPEEVWNCRCTMIADIGQDFNMRDLDWRNTNHMDDLSYGEWQGVSFDEWMNLHETRQNDGHIPADLFRNMKGVTDTFKRGMAEVLDKSTIPEAKQVYSKYADDLVCVNGKLKRGAYFRASSGGVHMNLEDTMAGSTYQTPYETAFHEYGHMIDWLGGGKKWEYLSNQEENGKRLLDVIKDDFKVFKKQVGAKKNADVIDILQGEKMSLHARANISDILEKCTNKSYPLGLGHGVAYHKREGATEREFFAEVLDSAASNPESYEQMKRLFPNAVDMVWSKVRRVM